MIFVIPCFNILNNTGYCFMKANVLKNRLFSIAAAVVMLLSAALTGCTNGTVPGSSSSVYNDEHPGEITYHETPSENIVSDDSDGLTYANNEILLTATDKASYSDIQQLAAKYGAEIKGYIEVADDYQLVLKDPKTKEELNEIITELKQSELVEDAQLNLFSGIGADAYYPNDERWEKQWNENNPDGENWGLEAIRCPTAWEQFNSLNTNAVNVGVMDGAFFSQHSDIRFEKLFANPPDNYFLSKRKTKENGEKNSPYERAFEGMCHGTHVSGTIGAFFNNSNGITGVYPLSRNHMYGASVFGLYEDDTPKLKSAAEIKSLLAELLVRDCRVINYSMGYSNAAMKYAATQGDERAINVVRQCSNIVSAFLRKMRSKGYDFIIVSSAGNDSDASYKKVPESNDYPWGYKKESGSAFIDTQYSNDFAFISEADLRNRIVMVGASEKTSKITGFFKWETAYKRADFSNTGDRLDIMAPGKDITSTGMKEDGASEDYLTGWDGTSMASPHVAGVAAMVWAVNNNFTGAEVKQILLDSANIEVDGSDRNMINASEAVRLAAERSNQTVNGTVTNNGVLMVGAYSGDSILKDASVEIYKAGTKDLVESGKVSENGTIELNLTPGKYDVVCKCSGYTDSIKQNVSVEYSKVTYAEIEMFPAVTSFTIPDSLVLTVGHLDLIQPVIEPQGASCTINWSSSDPSVVTVNPTGEYATIMGVKKGTATITAELNSGGNTLTRTTDVRVASQGRDTVLVLDVSGSMSGKPIQELKEAAQKFCDDLLTDEYNNRVGIVCFDDKIDYFDLTNDINELKSYISSIHESGSTNMSSGLQKAEEMLDNTADSDHIKNIVVMADGLPNEGVRSDSGSAGINSGNANYANGVVDTAQLIMQKYNMYSLGFFHSLSGTRYTDCVTLMSKLTNMPDGYHEVTNAEDLVFEFGDIATDIADGSKIIINIACPVDVTVSCGGETLSSAEESFNDQASFGKMELLGEKKDVKVLALDSDKKYDINLQGTGEGKMDYFVNYMDQDDNIEDFRNFSSVPITKSTIINTNTDNSTTVNLNVDTNGDGTVDIVYEAGNKEEAHITVNTTETTAPPTTEPATTQPQTEPETQPASVQQDNSFVPIMVIVAIGVFLVIGLIIMLIVIVSAKSNKSVEFEIPIIQNTPSEQEESKESAAAVKQEVNKETTPLKPENADAYIEILTGNLKASRIPLRDGETVTLGKNADICSLAFDDSYRNVSRKHCDVVYSRKNNVFYVTDYSKNGTYRSGNIRLEKNKKTCITGGTLLTLGNNNCIVRLKIHNH